MDDCKRSAEHSKPEPIHSRRQHLDEWGDDQHATKRSRTADLLACKDMDDNLNRSLVPLAGCAACKCESYRIVVHHSQSHRFRLSLSWLQDGNIVPTPDLAYYGNIVPTPDLAYLLRPAAISDFPSARWSQQQLQPEEIIRECKPRSATELVQTSLLPHSEAERLSILQGVLASYFIQDPTIQTRMMTTSPALHRTGFLPTFVQADSMFSIRSARVQAGSVNSQGFCAQDVGFPGVGSMEWFPAIPMLPPQSRFPRPQYDFHQTNESSAIDVNEISILQAQEYPPKRLPFIIATRNDRKKLSPRQVLLRLQIEVFAAAENDVTTHARGRNKKIKLGQVGLRCRHCAHLPVAMKQKGSTFFPAKLDGLYQAGQNMCAIHLQSGLCIQTPLVIKRQFVAFMSTKGSGLGVGSPYWTKAARKCGLVDSDDGIAFVPREASDEEPAK